MSCARRGRQPRHVGRHQALAAHQPNSLGQRLFDLVEVGGILTKAKTYATHLVLFWQAGKDRLFWTPI